MITNAHALMQVVDLADIFTGRLISEIPQALSALCDALSDHTSLVELDLSDNAFGGRCADALVPFLQSNTHFQIFKLNNNGLGPWGGSVVAKALLNNGAKCEKEGKESSLRVIVCGRNRLENGSAPDWAAAFGKHRNLKEVKMPQNGIRMEGIQALAEGLSNCKELEHLDLQDNTATKTGTRAIVKHLDSWPNLKHLNLSDCLLGSAGGIALTTSLSLGSNPKLESLKLQYGEMDKRAVELLSVAISQHLKELTVLELNGNRFSEDDECVEELKKALELWGHEEALDEREFPYQYEEGLRLNVHVVDDMEEPESEEEESEEEEEREEEEEETGEPDDGVDKGASGENKLPPVSDKQTDEFVFSVYGLLDKADQGCRLADMLAGVHVGKQ